MRRGMINLSWMEAIRAIPPETKTPEPLSEISSKQTPDTKPVSLSNATSNTGKSSSAGKHHMSFNPFSHHKSRKIRHQLPHQFHKMCHRYHQVVHLMHLLRILSRTHHQLHHQLHHHHQVPSVVPPAPPAPPAIPNTIPPTLPTSESTQNNASSVSTDIPSNDPPSPPPLHQVLHPTTPRTKAAPPPHHQHKLQDQNTKSSSSTSRVSSSNFNDLDLRQNAGTNLRKISALAYTINPRNASNGDSKPEKLVIDDKRFKFVNANALPIQEDLVREVKKSCTQVVEAPRCHLIWLYA